MTIAGLRKLEAAATSATMDFLVDDPRPWDACAQAAIRCLPALLDIAEAAERFLIYAYDDVPHTGIEGTLNGTKVSSANKLKAALAQLRDIKP